MTVSLVSLQAKGAGVRLGAVASRGMWARNSLPNHSKAPGKLTGGKGG